jgi:hypothetical protein
MNDSRKKIFITILIILVLIISSYIGGIIGFNKGFNTSQYFEGADALYTVAILESIRENRQNSAIQLLETKLDSQIFKIGFFEDKKDSILNSLSFTKTDSKADESIRNSMKKIVAYRKKYPPRPGKVINETLNKYDKEINLNTEPNQAMERDAQ